jgi:hypothetical protein
MRPSIGRRQQRGAVIITTALALLFLLGFMAISIDLGHLFVVKTEIQTAMDSCALAAAKELDGGSDALTRATSAGQTAADMNKVDLQQAGAAIAANDITFSDSLIGGFSHTFGPVSAAKYAKCTHTKSGITPWLMQAMAAFSGDSSLAGPRSVYATAVATLAPSQTNCALPIGVCQKPGGFQPGEWLTGAVNASEATTGQFRWVDFSGNGGGARELNNILRGEGQCQLPAGDTVVGKPGNNGSAADAYNTRFGIFQGSGAPPDSGMPDLTGYAWYKNTAPVQPPYPNKYRSAGGYLEKRAASTPYQGDNTAPDTTGLQTVGRTYSGSLASAGANGRRVVPVPVVDCAAFDGLSGSGTIRVASLACVLLLHPIKKGAGPSSTKMYIEYIGSASDPSSPCTTSGLPGGAAGPLVPVLVQ